MSKIIATTVDINGKDHSKHPNVKAGKCEFPFLYNGKIIKECQNGDNGPWCATEVNSQKRMTKLGFCPKSKKISIIRNSKKKSKKIDKKKNNLNQNNLNQNNLNQIPVGVPKGMEKYMRPDNDILNITHWENPNRKNFIQWFDSTFKKYRTKIDVPKVECDLDDNECIKKSVHPQKRDLFITQKIVRDYLSVNSPYRGLLLYHGLGVGKTCASIAIAESNKDNRKVAVLLKKSLKQNFIGQLKECGDEYYKTHQHWVFKSCSLTNEKTTYLFAQKIGIPKSALNYNKGAYFIDFNKKPNFGSLTKTDKQNINIQIDKMIFSKYDFKHTDGLTAAQLENMAETRYFDNKIVIVDEVHNIINGMTGDGGIRSTGLNELFMNSINTRFVFLSGTPMMNIPFEVAKIFNILRGYIYNYIITLSSTKHRDKIAWDKLEDELYEHPLIDQVIVDLRNKEVKLNRNPIGFINSPEGLVKSDINNITDSEFITSVTDFIKERMKYKVVYTKSEITTTFPDDNKEFQAMFYDSDKNDIRDKELFKRRTIGMVSYVANAKQELIPDITTKGPNGKRGGEVIRVPMSDYMFNKYAAVRKNEIERDSKSDGPKKVNISMKKKNELKGDVFQANSSYRAYSRMGCQFVFPEVIPRPFKGDIQDIEFDDDSDVAKAIVELKNEYDIKIHKAKKTVDKEKYKRELMLKIKEVKGKSKEYEKRLQSALIELDKNRDEYLQYDGGNPEKLMKYSPKYAMIVDKLLRDRGSKKKGLKFIYTEYKTCEGIGILSIVLKANGYSPFKIKKDINGEWELDFDPKTDKLPKYAVWSGNDQSDIILKIFNDNLNELPDKIRKQVEEINTSNRRGQLLEILMTTKQGSEGLNTRNVRQLHVVEPYWNPVRLDQVIGRAVRTNSHIELPKSERNVDIYIYLSKATKSQLSSDVTISNDFTGKTSDEVLYDIAERKREIMDIILGIIKDSAIDCSLNLTENIKSNKDIKCVNFGRVKTRKSFSYTANIKDEIKEKERATRVQTKKVNFITIKIKGILYMRNGNKIYDYDAVKAKRPGKPVGEIIEKDGKKLLKMLK